MRGKYWITVLAAVAAMALGCDLGGSESGPASTELPIGRVSRVVKTGNNEICVVAAYSDRGFKRDHEYCRGLRPQVEIDHCQVGERYPDCKE